MIWWEDFKVGETSDMGSHRFTEEEIVAFARQFDPQPFLGSPGIDQIRWLKPVRPGA